MDRDTKLGCAIVGGLALVVLAIALLIAYGPGGEAGGAGEAGETAPAGGEGLSIRVPAFAVAGTLVAVDFENAALAGRSVQVVAHDEADPSVRETLTIRLDARGRGRTSWRVPDWHVVVFSHPGSVERTMVVGPR